jgi:hypothetical protein
MVPECEASLSGKPELHLHFHPAHGRGRPFVTAGHLLVSDKIGKEVCQDSEKSQPRDTVSRENPRPAALPMPATGSLGKRRLGNRRDNRGPIFHAKPPNGKIVAQVHYASRLPRVVARQDYLSGSLLRFKAHRGKKFSVPHPLSLHVFTRTSRAAGRFARSLNAIDRRTAASVTCPLIQPPQALLLVHA